MAILLLLLSRLLFCLQITNDVKHVTSFEFSITFSHNFDTSSISNPSKLIEASIPDILINEGTPSNCTELLTRRITTTFIIPIRCFLSAVENLSFVIVIVMNDAPLHSIFNSKIL